MLATLVVEEELILELVNLVGVMATLVNVTQIQDAVETVSTTLLVITVSDVQQVSMVMPLEGPPATASRVLVPSHRPPISLVQHVSWGEMDKLDVLLAQQVTQVSDVKDVFRDILEIPCNQEITVKYLLDLTVSVIAGEQSLTHNVTWQPDSASVKPMFEDKGAVSVKKATST